MYGSVEGVKDNLPQLEDKIVPVPANALDIAESKVVRYLQEFSSQVDSLLSDMYQLPLQDSRGNTPEMIDFIVNNLAAYKLSRRLWTTFGAEENKQITALRNDAKELLQSLSQGDAVLHGVVKVNQDSNSIRDFLDNRTTEDEYFTMGDPTKWQDKL